MKRKSFAVPAFSSYFITCSFVCIIAFFHQVHAQDRSMYVPAHQRNYSQENDGVPASSSNSSRFFVGGNVGLSFSSNYSYVGISPLIGYRLTPWFSPGVNLNLNFVSDKSVPYQTTNYTTIGAGVFTRFFPFQWLYLQIQPEYNQYQVKVKSGGSIIDKQTYHVFSLLMGGGYIQRISENSYFNFGILYDVIQNPHSPYYGIPVIQGGMNIGF